MEFFTKGKAVKLRSHLDKYLTADDDKSTVRQSRNAVSKGATWTVEIVDDKANAIRLRSYHGTYLTASESPFLLGMTGKKAIQAGIEDHAAGAAVEWEPERDGFQVRLRSWCGKYLRGNGGSPP